MKRRAIVGLAPIALLGGCGDRGSLDQVAEAQITETTVAAVTAPEVTTEVTLGADIEELIVDTVWEDQRDEICPVLNDAVDTGVLSREAVIDFAMTYVGDITATQKARLRDLIDRDC